MRSRFAGTKSDESTFISSVRIVPVDGVKVTVEEAAALVATAVAAAGFNVERRSTMLLLVELTTDVAVSPDMEDVDRKIRSTRKGNDLISSIFKVSTKFILSRLALLLSAHLDVVE